MLVAGPARPPGGGSGDLGKWSSLRGHGGCWWGAAQGKPRLLPITLSLAGTLRPRESPKFLWPLAEIPRDLFLAQLEPGTSHLEG